MARAIDMHVHVPPQGEAARHPLRVATQAYFRAPPLPEGVEAMAQYYAERDIVGVLLAEDWEAKTGLPPVSNDFIADIVRRYPGQFIGFCCVDPWKGKKAIDEVRRSVEDLGLRGVKFHPSLQEFFPDDHRFYPLWETIARLGVPALFHSGMTGFGAGSPGGGGIKTKYCAPIPHIDDLAADFPELTIIMAHPAFPWVDEQIAVLLHKPNVFMDLSGYSPKYFPPQLVQYANTLLQDKVMFGSDYPMIMPERWLSDFEAAPFREDVRPKILRDNAVRVLRLDA
ncbi:hypothetical protein HRbin24_02027 [bacterium HR24]|nr:hypothetical protein HRbin24_02027 [bacterium HR24]